MRTKPYEARVVHIADRKVGAALCQFLSLDEIMDSVTMVSSSAVVTCLRCLNRARQVPFGIVQRDDPRVWRGRCVVVSK